VDKVVVVIPAYNEQSTIRKVVEDVRALGYPVLVVDDGSTDATAIEAEAGGAIVLRNAENYGVGESISIACVLISDSDLADIVVTTDGDGQIDPTNIPSAINALKDCDLVSGSRFLGIVWQIPWHRRIVLGFVSLFMWILTGLEFTDPCCGLKAFRPAAFKIKSQRMAWACELTYRVSRWGRIKEIPAHVRYTEYSLRKGQRSRDAFKVGWELIRAVTK
jgi:polyprenyl-phospho-N-acetylgalactosaminyl synthase